MESSKESSQKSLTNESVTSNDAIQEENCEGVDQLAYDIGIQVLNALGAFSGQSLTVDQFNALVGDAVSEGYEAFFSFDPIDKPICAGTRTVN